MDGLLVALSYLVGSLAFGVIAGLLRGTDIRRADLPGGSGVFRQLGPAWGVAVALLDMAKGAVVAYLSVFAEHPWTVPLMALGVVAGHTWPLYFGFRGGGGIAPTLGFFLYLRPGPTLAALGVGLLGVLLYYLAYWRHTRRGIYPIPFGAIWGYAYLLYALRTDPKALSAVLLVALAVLARGLQILMRRR
ncbi:glycerol-3-phosphate acyltransferase [Marinithermus hydrothermalis]|uniref:Glycerol-3-phosphate acyltransferase n=1 Tax=Marinithermus hydrothermalis (strain DSM 14884 / JCM 11576 / T1) TaxID=869210 RepID=F2NQU1_MARHT|nr:glycerol-3-phosphate acyltransferase [Marinithermus hydrothermalis]AEB12305.1 protein of unknown function DUF205 [Marinithermus hydrothermalis DSM 14884]